MRGRLQQLGILRESRDTSTLTDRVVIPVFDLARQRHGDVRAQDHGRICGRARRCISICPARTAACGMKRRCSCPKRSSCANRSSTR